MLCPKFNLIGFNSFQARFLYSYYKESCIEVYDDGKQNQTLSEGKYIKSLDVLLKNNDNKSHMNVLCVFNPSAKRKIINKLKNFTLIDVEEFAIQNNLNHKVINFPNSKDLKILQNSSLHFQDDLSLKTYNAILQYWVTGFRSELDEVVKPESAIYFEEDFLNLCKDEVFVDVGAFDGDSFRSFQGINPIFKEAHLFEPVKSILINLKNVKIYKVALGNKEKEVVFSDGGLNSSLRPNGNIKVQLKKLDTYQINPTYIKIDAEGMDIDVLKGAKETILENKPKIAVSVYHKPLDLVEAYNYLSEFNYSNFYLRKYQLSNEETVLYAIP